MIDEREVGTNGMLAGQIRDACIYVADKLIDKATGGNDGYLAEIAVTLTEIGNDGKALDSVFVTGERDSLLIEDE